ncbi:MAG: tripartite tricarboxylate transporter substrate binding protein [Burkholderiaceae bacterium]
MQRSRRQAAAALCGSLATAWLMPSAIRPAHAQPPAFVPVKPVRIIAPSSPGGILDLTSRMIATTWSERLPQPVVVENLPGAGGTIGIQGVLRADPDGHTLVMGSLGPNAANYTLQDKLPYAAADLAPVVFVLSMPDVVVVNPNLPIHTLAELKSHAATRPNGLSMAISTSGSSGHLAGELLKSRIGIPAVGVVYRGAAPALNDLVAGQVDFMVDNLITALPLIRAGKLRALAITTRERAPELPDVPTVIEQGYPDFDVSVWLGLFVSSKVPAATVQALNADLNRVLADPALRDRIAQQGGKAEGGSTQRFDDFVRAETKRWGQVIQAAGINAQ